MALPHSHSRLVADVQEILTRDAGYAKDQVRRDYDFADYSGATPKVRQVDLAAFAPGDQSYRSACVAVKVVAPGQESIEARQLAWLGASRALIVAADKASIWELGGEQREVRIATHDVDEIPRLLRTTAAEWSPAQTSRANRAKAPGLRQTDLVDLGFIQALEEEINTKLYRLLNEVFHAAELRAPKLRTSKLRFPRFVRAIFYMLTAKVLVDRGHSSASGSMASATDAIRIAKEHLGTQIKTRNLNLALLDEAWCTIQDQFHFQNVSTDNLAFIYERALVDDTSRKTLGIHATPRWVAEQVLDLLPLDELPADRQRVVELCSGYGPFLLAALERLKPLGPIDDAARHAWLVERLHGVEIEPFALEVSRLCLTLADYPSPDGWRLEQGDVFDSGTLKDAIRGAGVVLSNPPYEDFNMADRSRVSAQLVRKPAELIRRILEVDPPPMLGVVIPKSLIDSRSSTNAGWHDALRRQYAEIDTLSLPKVFTRSDSETIILVARGLSNTRRTFSLRSASVQPSDLESVRQPAWQPDWQPAVRGVDDDSPLWTDPLADVWARLSGLDPLKKRVQVHQGIQYKRGKEITLARLADPQTRWAPGVLLADQIPLFARATVGKLVTDPNELRRGGKFPWTEPKVIVNAARRSRQAWCITASVDSDGLWCYQRAHGVWPRKESGLPLEVLAAILNGPLANAWVHGRSGKTDLQVGTYASIPMPRLNRIDTRRVVALVRQAMSELTVDIVQQIDAEILRGYGLPARLEAKLLRSMECFARPGLPGFERYYPKGFESNLSLHQALRLLTPENRGDALSLRLPKLNDPDITALFDFIEDNT